ncbi:helix-turn-helix domain-containing protein [Kitasatospora sp. CM 4170]|uniref:TetR/AcrR family transcriptional regulator n=1 Tax=Kitasatospora aburaviensis TaxID=67265 RepID=A0ABW1EUC2_9ACTN|nr:helix-turn-helix domain-containing protein [Kitasatospora sp. CM 4170]WNM49574.1 helix-turn-helix domain-containing protein [Kitasatospora sp. CM 4170]
MTPAPARRTDARPADARRTDARRNRERLLAAAQEVFAETGAEASLNEIARRAGVGPGTLYRHFPTRAALLAAVLRERVERLCARAGELVTSRPADRALVEWLGAFLTHARTHQGLAGALLLEASDELGADCHRLIEDAAAEVLTHAQREGTARPDLTPGDLLQLALGVALTTTGAEPEDDARAERLLALVLDAVLTPRAHHRPDGNSGA